MREIASQNLSAFEPLTPLNIDEPCRYVRCNLTNRLVHPESIVERCQEAQMIFARTDRKDFQTAEATPDPTKLIMQPVGAGVTGQVRAADVTRVRKTAVEPRQTAAVEAER